MNGKKNISYGSEQIPEYLVDQLASGILPTFLPVSFVYEESRCLGVYHTEHFRTLASIEQIAIKDLLMIVCQLLTMLNENEKHYVFGETYQIHVSTVYVDALFSKVRMVFQPLARLCTTKEQLTNLLQDCIPKVSEEGRPYLEDMIHYINREAIGYFQAVRHGETLQNEIYLCDIT